MRRRTALDLLVPAAVLLIASAAHAEEPSCAERPNAVVADLGLHVVNAGYQRVFGCHVTVQATAGLYGPWTVTQNVLGLGGGDRTPDEDVIGMVLRGRVFFHPLGRAPGGLWISPYTQAGPVRSRVASEKIWGPAFAAGLSAGWTWRLGNHVLLGLGLGAQYHRASFLGRTARPGFSLFGPTVDINVGFRF
ncbi:MAG TPA: hypothetical protein VM694_40160 [Polyangium sp.]|nr:hypothetical protein [Polyangium sp.]